MRMGIVLVYPYSTNFIVIIGTSPMLSCDRYPLQLNLPHSTANKIKIMKTAKIEILSA